MEKLLSDTSPAQRVAVTSHESIRVMLKWKRPGVFGRMFNGYVDLDLGCYYELASGERRLIDCLQFRGGQGGDRNEPTKQGCYSSSPYIWHSGDVPGSDAISIEELIINPAGLGELKKFMVYAYIFEGPTRWAAVEPELRICVPGSDDVIIKIAPEKGKRFVAVAGITAIGNKAIDIELLNTSHDGHADCDREYGWGFSYHGLSK